MRTAIRKKNLYLLFALLAHISLMHPMGIPLTLPNFASIIQGIGGYLNGLFFNQPSKHQFPQVEQPKNQIVSNPTTFVSKAILVESPIARHSQWISDGLQSKLLTQLQAPSIAQIVPSQSEVQLINTHIEQKQNVNSCLNKLEFLRETSLGGCTLYESLFTKAHNFNDVHFGFSIGSNQNAKSRSGFQIPLVNAQLMADSIYLESLAQSQMDIIERYEKTGRSEYIISKLNAFAASICDLARSDLQGTIARAQLADLKLPCDLPLLEHYLDKFKHDVAWFTHSSDGSAKTILSVSDQYNIARCCEWLFRVGVNSEYANNVVHVGCEKQIGGFEYIGGLVKHSLWQRISNELRFSGAVLNPINFREQKIRNHPFNQVVVQSFELCKKGDFASAYQLIEAFPNGIYKEQLESIYQNVFETIYNRYGIEHRFENDPLFAKLAPTLEQSKIPTVTNSIFIQRQEAYDKIINQLPSKDVSPLVQEMVWHVVDHLTDGSFNSYDAATYFCNRLSSDSSDPAIRQAYHQFFDKNGLMCFLNHEPGFLKEMHVPESIHTAVYVQERVILNVLSNIKATNVDKPHIEQAMHYVANACNDSSLSKEYRVLAQEITDALIKQGHDQAILKCGDFSNYPVLLSDVADIVNQRNAVGPTNFEYPKFNTSIELLDFARTVQSTGNDKLADKCIHRANEVIAHAYKPITSLPAPGEIQKPSRPSSSGSLQENNASGSAPASSEPKWYEKLPIPTFKQIVAAALVHAVDMKMNELSYSRLPEYEISQSNITALEVCPVDSCQEFLNDMQPIVSSGAQAATIEKEKKEDCNEPATKIPEAVQKILAEVANAYFRDRIAEHEEEIVKLIEAKLKEKGLVYPFPIMIKDIDMAHVMFPDWNYKKNRPKGLHSDHWCPERIVEVVIPKGILGTWKGKWQLNCKSKKSTFFPTVWDEKFTIDKIIESLLNIDGALLVDGALQIDGITSEGIVIETILGFSGKITTTYPAEVYKDRLCIY